jgi:glycosyltransferase involved in cell wall biosynthesis
MKIAFIACWCYLRIYSIQSSHLKENMEKIIKGKIDVITSNCGCYYSNIPKMLASPFTYKSLLTSTPDSFIKLPHLAIKKGNVLGYTMRSVYGSVAEPVRHSLFLNAIPECDIVHFHQSGGAFSYGSLKHFLTHVKKQKKVVTLHTQAPEQIENPRLNTVYDKADAVIVGTQHMKDVLSNSGVHAEKIHVVRYGATLKPLESAERRGAIMFAGSPLIGVKGFQYLAAALRMLKEENIRVPLKLHGFFMAGHKEWAIDIAQKENIQDLIEWLKIKSEDELIRAYQNSLLCVIPYTDYPGSFPVTVAMANGLPIVASDAMGTSEYMHGNGLVCKTKSAEDLAAAIKKVVTNSELSARMGKRSREIAEEHYSWPVLAGQTMELYKKVLG